MKAQAASVLILTALIIGFGIGYLGNTPIRTTVTERYTVTTTAAAGPGLEVCTVTEYAVWSILSIQDSTTAGRTTTQSRLASTFQTVGHPTSYTETYTGTLTGAIASWNSTTCS